MIRDQKLDLTLRSCYLFVAIVLRLQPNDNFASTKVK